MIWILSVVLSSKAFSQAPVASFTISPNPICTGQNNVVQVVENSSNSPTSWTYTVTNGGPNSATFAVQSPSFSFNQQGTYTVILVAGNSSGQSTPVAHTLQVLSSPNAQMASASQTTCIGGNPITLSIHSGGPGSGSLTYSWSTSVSTSSISVSPAATTVYTCVITSTNGCSVTRTATVAIGQPIISITSNPTNICPGSASTITATGTTPSPFTYSWSTGATTRTISTTAVGVYTVTVMNGNGCSASQTYSISSSTTLALAVTAAPATLCAGNTATLRVTGASTYTWSSGSATQNTTVNPSSATVYTVQGQVGTCAGSATILLNVGTSPTIQVNTNSQTICAGNSALLIANGATTYTWFPSITVSSSLSVSPSVNTTYSVRGTNPGCQGRTGTITIAVSPSPVINVTSSSSLACAGEVVALAASGAVTYTWSEGATTNVVLVTPTVTTTYTVTGANGFNCSVKSTITQSVNACVGIEDEPLANSRIQLFPNPTNGSFEMKSAVAVDVGIVNQCGQVIRSISLKPEESYSVADLAAGIYFIIGQNELGSARQKIVVSN